MAHAVPQVPFGAEAQGLEALGFLKLQVLHAAGRIGRQGVRRRAGEHLAHRQEADQRQESVDAHQHIPGEPRRVQRPGGHIDVGRHGPIRVHDEPAQPVPDADAQRRTHEADNQGISRIMNQDAPILEAQGLEGADLGLFAGGDAVHGGHHGQYGDGQEQHRQDGGHGFAFVHLAHGLRPGYRFVLGENQPGRTQGLVRLLHESGLVQVGFHVDLKIHGADECFVQGGNGLVQHGRGHIDVAVGGIVRHHLGGIRQANQVFAGFHQPLDGPLHGDGLVGQRQRVAQGNAVGRGVGIRQPEAVRGGRVVGFPGHDQDARHVHVLTDRQGQGVGIVLH